jgi:hypothetical protein
VIHQSKKNTSKKPVQTNRSQTLFTETVHKHCSQKPFTQTVHKNLSQTLFTETVHKNLSKKPFTKTFQKNRLQKPFKKTFQKARFARPLPCNRNGSLTRFARSFAFSTVVMITSQQQQHGGWLAHSLRSFARAPAAFDRSRHTIT